MSPPATLAELVDLVRRTGVADDDAVERFRIGRTADELGAAEVVAGAMIRDGLLTPYQVQRLLRGEARGLRIGGRYRVLDKIGGGGMGRVFLCQDNRTGGPVAVKVMAGGLGQDPQATARFHREGRAATRLDHPALVPALDVGADGRQLYLALEFVDGADLYRYVGTCGPLEPATAAYYVARAADALQAAADQGWVHRDVKPHNLMVDRAGRLRVLDLGLARPCGDDSSHLQVTDPEAADALLGTVDFIAPEQVDDSSGVDGRADIYALGATFYFLLAGRPPLPDGSTGEKLEWLRSNDPVPIREVRPEVPPDMADVLARMMAKDPDDRYQAPREVCAALAAWAESAPPVPDPAALVDWPPAVRQLLGLPAREGAPAVPSVVAPLASSFPRRPGLLIPADRRPMSGWVAVLALLVGVITALLLAVRSGAIGPALSADAARPAPAPSDATSPAAGEADTPPARP
jgi:hypothetical protein